MEAPVACLEMVEVVEREVVEEAVVVQVSD
jgi:hypothetical protein